MFAGACSAEDLAERAVEEAVEADLGGDVELDFDSDDGSISIETDSIRSFSTSASTKASLIWCPILMSSRTAVMAARKSEFPP